MLGLVVVDSMWQWGWSMIQRVGWVAIDAGGQVDDSMLVRERKIVNMPIQ